MKKDWNENDLLDAVEEITGHRFNNVELLVRAFTHPSFSSENPDAGGNYERLEYLGDAVLDLAVAEFLYQTDLDLREGGLTVRRSELVCGVNLTRQARELELGALMRLGKGEAESGGADRDSNLANVFEALFGALFLDAGYHHAAKLARELLFEELPDSSSNPKGDLQEYCHRKGWADPAYGSVVEGPDHRRLYRTSVTVDGRMVGEGVDTSRKGAETLAAAAALETLRSERRKKRESRRRRGRRRRR